LTIRCSSLKQFKQVNLKSFSPMQTHQQRKRVHIAVQRESCHGQVTIQMLNKAALQVLFLGTVVLD
jgi:hypothetical protein